MDLAHLKSWIGRTEQAVDTADRRPLDGLAALLDREPPATRVPPLGHWLYFAPNVRQSQLGADGHPQRGGFLPPVPLPRRMWAGGRVDFHAPIPIGAALERRSVIADVEPKAGATGDMLFVTVEHTIHADGRLAISERQDLVYRAGGGAAPAASRDAAPDADLSRTLAPDPVALFRYSALTFNAHRIHYDRDYARGVEGYPGLVVHGPLAATLLVDLFLEDTPGARIAGFDFRARRPLFDTAPFTVNLRRGRPLAEAWTADAAGQPAMTARIEWEMDLA